MIAIVKNEMPSCHYSVSVVSHACVKLLLPLSESKFCNELKLELELSRGVHKHTRDGSFQLIELCAVTFMREGEIDKDF